MSFDIHDEPAPGHSPEVVALMGEAIEALNQGQAAKAETRLKQALEIEPGSPVLLNNLGAIYSQQGCQDEAVAIAQKLYEEHPDYFFGIVSMANLHIQRGEVEQAKALLQPLMSCQRLHIAEFRALCISFIQLHLAEGTREAAQNWLNMWTNVDPDHPDVSYWQQRIASAGHQPRLGNWRKLLGF